MENIKTIKLAVTGFFALLSSWLGMLAAPMYILVLLNMADYATGFVAAPYRGEKRSSEVGFRGIAKKCCMWLLVALGGVLDWLVTYAKAALAAKILAAKNALLFIMSSNIWNSAGGEDSCGKKCARVAVWFFGYKQNRKAK